MMRLARWPGELVARMIRLHRRTGLASRRILFSVVATGVVAGSATGAIGMTLANTAFPNSVVGIAMTSHGGWEVTAAGHVIPFDGAASYGSAPAAITHAIAGIAASPDGRGYWLVASDGGIFAFGDAPFYGSTGAITLNKPIVGMAATPDGHGYWLVASDGGIFAFGDAPFYGSTGAITLNKPIVGMAAAPMGHGYWLVASDGGVFTFGNAHFYGSSASRGTSPVSGIVSTPGGGYVVAPSTGNPLQFGPVPSGLTQTIGTVLPITGTPISLPSLFSIQVSGNQFVNELGQVVHLRGVNRPGTEYGCVQNLGFISSDNGTSGQSLSYADTLVKSFQTWNKTGALTNAINAVRIPLNEDCWLGINGVPAAYSGANYQAFIEREVSDFTAAGIYSILDLHWSAPGSFLATTQDVEPNTDHSVTFWRQVAGAFADNQAVMFDLFNEPRAACYTTACSSNYSTAVSVSWGCYLNGCSYTYSSSDGIPARDGYTFQIAGTQELVNTIRAAGASNVILVEGTGYANDLWNWMAWRPTDPDNNIAAEIHTYTSSGQNATNTTTLDQMISAGGLNSKYPIYLGEFGESICSGGSNGFTQKTINWAEGQNIGWTAWGWDEGETCSGPSLVTSDSAGTPSVYGAIVKANLDSLES